MATNPAYVNSPIVSAIQLTTANGNLDGTGATTGFQGVSASGAMTENIKIKSVGKTNAGKIRVFYYNGSAYLIREIEVPESQEGFEYDKPFKQLVPNGAVIKYSTELANTFNVITSGGDF